MFKNIYKAIVSPLKALRFFRFGIYYYFRKKRGTLVFIGMDPKGVFNLMYRGFNKCYGFEANPERYQKLAKKFKNNPRVEIIHAAAADYDGEITLNISSNNNGASSSIGTFNEEWEEKYEGKKIEMVKSITVPCINLMHFCKKKEIEYIDEYFSDIQGIDLTVLKTLKVMIVNKKIGSITCEVASNEKGNVYKGLSDNSEAGFNSLLSENYYMVAKGWGALRDGHFDKISPNSWEFDCKWRLKD